MGCSTCANKNKEKSPGCQNNGVCGTEGCNKFNVFDWLGNMDLPGEERPFDVVEVSFKAGRKAFYRNVHDLELNAGDPVVVNMPTGWHIGHVSLQGEIVRLQMRKKQVEDDDNIPAIQRHATSKDLEKYEEARKREMNTMFRSRQIADKHNLNMKMSDVEYQADNTKATFYYSAEERVDFRNLIKDLAREFKIKVEMKQISLRNEAGRIGGIGSCGRELCCSTWLSEFKTVSTSAARYQNLSLNPSKLSGQCGRLKCCLNYELDTYLEALENIPKVEEPLITNNGKAYLQKTDIFKKTMWFGYENDDSWYALSVDRVNEILELNQNQQYPDTLEQDEATQSVSSSGKLNTDLEKLDKKLQKKSQKQASGNKQKSNTNKSNKNSGNKNRNKKKNKKQ